ncbi:CZB domain-containing protein [Rufibacter sediminis]|uniref:CZB domain-containing protein n=1 Tax=Rufibacter sediminis TaxID=2762756 RepID=A0ABR6VZ13_9BACT|nr:CZB domain-containing protein [Rufibacter sediminis]MBC3542405.1 CZB domain-containing protein [Rufibacter sediminis]
MNINEQDNYFESIGRLDFEQARIKHVLFKSKLRALLYGAAIDTEPVLSTTDCSLGKWIYDVAIPRIGHLLEVKELEKVHDQMHVIARRLWQLYQQGRQEEALTQLSQIDQTAERLLHLLDQIERKAVS